MTSDHSNCRCSRCFFQDNFTVILLFILVVLSLGITVLIMHEKALSDEYAKWAQGFTAGLLTSLTLSMNRSAEKPHPLAPGTTEATLRVEPPAAITPKTVVTVEGVAVSPVIQKEPPTA